MQEEQNIEMGERKAFATQTEPAKEDAIEKPPEYDYGAQTDFIVERPVFSSLEYEKSQHQKNKNRFKKLVQVPK